MQNVWTIRRVAKTDILNRHFTACAFEFEDAVVLFYSRIQLLKNVFCRRKATLQLRINFRKFANRTTQHSRQHQEFYGLTAGQLHTKVWAVQHHDQRAKPEGDDGFVGLGTEHLGNHHFHVLLAVDLTRRQKAAFLLFLSTKNLDLSIATGDL